MTHTCKEIHRVHLLIDGELYNDDHQRIKDHLRTCSICRSEWESLSRLSRMMDHVDEVVPRAGFDRDFWDKIEAYDQTRQGSLMNRLSRWPLGRAMIPVAVALVLTAGLYLSMKTSNPFPENMPLADQMDLLEAMDVVDNLDLLENWEAINRMNVKS